MTIEDLAESARPKVESSDFDSSVKFDCGEDGALLIDHQTITTGDGEADCTISLSLEDLEALFSGELDATAAFMQGKMKIDGDMSVAMKLNGLL